MSAKLQEAFIFYHATSSTSCTRIYTHTPTPNTHRHRGAPVLIQQKDHSPLSYHCPSYRQRKIMGFHATVLLKIMKPHDCSFWEVISSVSRSVCVCVCLCVCAHLSGWISHYRRYKLEGFVTSITQLPCHGIYHYGWSFMANYTQTFFDNGSWMSVHLQLCASLYFGGGLECDQCYKKMDM